MIERVYTDDQVEDIALRLESFNKCLAYKLVLGKEKIAYIAVVNSVTIVLDSYSVDTLFKEYEVRVSKKIRRLNCSSTVYEDVYEITNLDALKLFSVYKGSDVALRGRVGFINMVNAKKCVEGLNNMVLNSLRIH